MSEREFEPQPMVAWLEPKVLAFAALEVALSKLFTNFADKREQQAGLEQDVFPCEPGPAGDLWLDYVSDAGDGYVTASAVARLLASDTLTIDGVETRRGQALVLGGDQVYPSAKWERYQDRFVGPYREALPEAEDDRAPTMYALPGNHDWYDGLTSFMRLFCQRGRIGGWRTEQARSYFALRLVAGWWLWAIDSQLDRYLDGPQVEYFRARAAETMPGDRVILVTAKPSWVTFGEPGRDTQPWESLAFFEHEIIAAGSEGRARLALTITGDLHHYSRYVETGSSRPPQQKVTAGGGGAYLSATHWLRDTLALPSFREGIPDARYTCARRWPTAAESKSLRRGVLRHLWPFETFSLNAVFAALYGLIALLVVAGVKDNAPSLREASSASVGDAVTSWLVVAAVLLWVLLAAFARYEDVRPAKRAGLIHAVLQFAAAFALSLLALRGGANLLESVAEDGFWLGYLVAVAVAAFGGAVIGRAIFVLYLFLAHWIDPRWHANAVFAAQSRRAGTAFKHFLRLRIDPEGALTVFPIGVPDVLGGSAPEWVEPPFTVERG